MKPVLILCAVLFSAAALSLRWSSDAGPADGVTAIFGDEPRTLDPALATSALEGRILSGLFEGLAVPDGATLEPRPGVAESWDISADGLHYVFHLRGDAKWSDGSPVTAEDFRWSWTRVLSTAEATNWELFAPIRGARAFRERKTSEVAIRAAGERRLEVELERPAPWFLSLVATMTYLPVKRAAVEAHGRQWTRPGHFVGNGPYVLAAWEPNHRLVLERNAAWRDAASVQVSRLTLLSVPQGPTQFNLYDGGVVDWIVDPNPDLVRDLGGRADLHVTPSLGVSLVRFATTGPVFRDRRLRQAFSLSIDRQRITRTNGAGQEPWQHIVPRGLPGYAGLPRDGFDPVRARALLAEAGKPARVRFLYPSQKDTRVVAETLQAVWQEQLGVEIVLDRVDRKEWARRMRAVDYDICLGSWIGDYPDPSTFLDIFISGSPNNRTGWSDAAYDALIAEARGQTGPARLATLAKAEARLLDEAPLAPLYMPVTIELWKPHVEGLTPNVLGLHPLKDLRRRP